MHSSDLSSRRGVLSAIGGGATVALAGCSGKLGGGGTTTIQMATSTEDSSAYQLSQGIASVVNEQSDEIKLDARPADGSVQSMSLLDKEEIDMAYINRYVAYQILNEEGQYADNPFDHDIAQVFHYYDVSGQLTSRKSGDIRSVTDLAGKRISPHVQGSAIREAYMDTLKFAVDTDKIDLRSVGLSDQSAQIKSGSLDAAWDLRINATTTPSYIQDLYATVDDLRILDTPDDVVSSIKDAKRLSGSYYTPDQLGTDGFDGREKVWFVDNLYDVYTRKNVDADTINTLLNVMWDNIDQISETHALANKWKNLSFFSKLDDNIAVHEGATSFFEDAGAEGY